MPKYKNVVVLQNISKKSYEKVHFPTEHLSVFAVKTLHLEVKSH